MLAGRNRYRCGHQQIYFFFVLLRGIDIDDFAPQRVIIREMRQNLLCQGLADARCGIQLFLPELNQIFELLMCYEIEHIFFRLINIIFLTFIRSVC